MTVALLLVLAWGTLTALDLVAFGQFMIGRPLVAGTVAGYLVGDPAAGVLVGGLLELYALETLAVGGAHYPDFGPAAVAGTVALAHAPVALALGVAGGLGLVVAWLGEWSIVWLRRSTTRAVRARAVELDAGDRRILVRLHLGGIARDALRGMALTAVGHPRVPPARCASGDGRHGRRRGCGTRDRLRRRRAVGRPDAPPRVARARHPHGDRMGRAMNRRVLWRLAVIQGSWNYDRMVGLGLGFAALPLLPPATGHSDEALARLSAHFNAHPYLAGLAVGALARMERDGRPAVDVMRLRDALRGPLGSIGDELFWAGVLPTAAGLGLVAATQGPSWAGAVMLLGVHNLMHVPVRGWALDRGWELGRDVARALGARWLARARGIATTAAPLAVGLAMVPALWWLVDGVGPRLGAAVVASAAVIAHRLAPTMGGVRIGILAALAALLGGGL